MGLAADLNRAITEGRDLLSQQAEAKLVGAYVSAITQYARLVAERFRELTPVLAAASWSPPQADDVIAVSVSTERVRRTQLQLLEIMGGTVGAVEGVDWTITHPVVQEILDTLGLRADAALREGVREPVARAIADSWARGLSVPDTAKAIQQAVSGIRDWQATMLARTDLIGASNGMGHWAAEQLNAAAHANRERKPIATKTWVSAGDTRVRDTHQEAEGQTVPMEQPFTVGGVALAYPGDPSGPDSEVLNCRCVELFNEEAAVRASAEPLLKSIGSGLTASIRPLRRVPSETTEEVAVKTKPRIPAIRLGRTITVKPDLSELIQLVAAAETDDEGRTLWESDMCFEGVSTGDGRFMVLGSLGHRDLPLTLMAMTETTAFGGHDGAGVAGRIDTFEKRQQTMDGDKLPSDQKAIYSTGVFDLEGYGQEIERMVDDRMLNGISVDLSVNEWGFRDPETGEILDPEEMTDDDWDRAWFGELEFAVIDGTVMASTVCPTPAFADARIAILASAMVPFGRNVWLASGEYAQQLGVEEGQLMTTLVASARPKRSALAAAGGTAAKPSTVYVTPRRGIAPLRPDRDAFFQPEPKEPQPIVISDDGVLTGHLALWETCHTGYVNGAYAQCVTPPRSPNQYADFHLGPIECDDGDFLEIGKLTVGTGHADIQLGRVAARAHYDNTGTVGAYVRALDGKHGVWLSGVTRSDMTDEQLRDLRVNPPSGDWRDAGGHLELQAALAVVVPGFPVKRSQLALSAAADGTVLVKTLILAAGAVGRNTQRPVEFDVVALDAAVQGPEALDELIQADDCGCQ